MQNLIVIKENMVSFCDLNQEYVIYSSSETG
jgi:hypothetical protein